MSKTWDELSNDAFKLAEDLYNDMIARGIEIDPKTKSKYEELSKFHQPTVISAVCAHARTKLKGSRHNVIKICVDCGKYL